VFAQVEGDKFTAFLVERGQPGFEVMAEEHKLGIKGSSTCALRFKDVRVPAAKRIGDIGKGHKIALNMLNLGRLKLGTTMLGACKELIEHTIRYTGERHQFGKPINSFGLIRRKIAEMGALVFAGEAMAYRTAALIDAHMTASGDEANRACKLNSADEYSAECSLVKVFLTEAATICADHAVQCYGGYGFSEEYPVARFYRDVRVSRIYEGTNEINRIHAANTIVRRTFPGGKSTELAASLESMINATLTDGTLGNMKRAFGQLLRAVGLSAGANGKIRLEQDVQGAIADAAMHLFAVDSSLRRAARAEGPEKRYATTMAELVQCRSAAAFVTAVNHAVAGGSYRIGGLDRLLHTIFDATRDQFQHERDAAEMMIKQ
jgi:alkylation response protein AidB-like acyl-CoA dehydrogenase